ncbi:MAG TPA: acetylornithine deacetylase [Woeseiaceae bacterium]|nr:acetylornithine deacetylase [Woeseiaceae bacterium]
MQASPRKVIGDIGELIGIPSVSCSDESFDMSNKAVLERLSDMLQSAGFRVEWTGVDGQDDKFNLVATLGRGPGGLVLSGHSDTVPFDADSWSSDPFELTERDGRLYGLGTADMKSFFALALAAAARISANDLKRRLIVVATADEETGMSGARSLAFGRDKLADFALIGEPTNLRPVRVHKGILAERIVLVGRSGHSSNPALGVSAVDGLRAVLNELTVLRLELQTEFTDDSFQVPHPTINFGRVRGGDNPNRICAECLLDLDCRFLPGMKLHDVRKRIHQRVRDCTQGSGLEVSFRPLFHGIEAMNTPADSELVRAVESLTGHEAGAVAFATEAPIFAGMGTEVVVAGAGSIDQAHQPDEYLELSAIEPAVGMLERLIGRYCTAS